MKEIKNVMKKISCFMVTIMLTSFLSISAMGQAHGDFSSDSALAISLGATRTITFELHNGDLLNGSFTRTMSQSATTFATVMDVDNMTLLNPVQGLPSRVVYNCGQVFSGYMFVGWYTAEDGGTRVNHNTMVIPGAMAITLHARWEELMTTQPVC